MKSLMDFYEKHSPFWTGKMGTNQKWKLPGFRAECRSCNWKRSAKFRYELNGKTADHYVKSGHFWFTVEIVRAEEPE